MTTAATPFIEVDDLIVLLLGAPTRIPRLQNKLNGITRLEKLIFLLERELPRIDAFMKEDAEFSPHNFGPFSSKIYQAVEMLTAAELMEELTDFSSTLDDTWEMEQVIGVDEAYSYSERRFCLTSRGIRYYGTLAADLPRGLPEQIGAFKDRFGGLPLRQLIRYVYERYDDYIGSSLIRGEILGK